MKDTLSGYAKVILILSILSGGYSTKVLDSTLDIKILDPDGGLDLAPRLASLSKTEASRCNR